MSAPVRAIDHAVIATRDLELAGECYRRLGFQVTPRMRHSALGTSNRIVHFQENYLELLGDLQLAPALLRDAVLPRIAGGDGLLALSLASSDLLADRAQLRGVGLSVQGIGSARRLVTMPDGGLQETDSFYCDVWHEHQPFLSMFLTQHLKPESIWIPAYQKHPNTAFAVRRVTYVSNDPEGVSIYLSHLIGAAPARSQRRALAYRTARSEVIEVLAPDQLTGRYGRFAPEFCAALCGHGIGLRFQVESLAACVHVLRSHATPFIEYDGIIAVTAELGAGVFVEFTQEEIEEC